MRPTGAVMRTRRLLALLAFALALALPGDAVASQLIGRDAKDVRLQVDAGGRALLTYRSTGSQRRVLAWGAVNAVQPATGARQVAFRVDYSGGWGTFRQKVWEGFPDVCGPYSGPALAWFVTGCTAPDGSHWAVQSWQRLLPSYGVAPSARQAAWELRLSHWSTELAQVQVNVNWAYRRFDHLFGSFAYLGAPVYGFASTSRGMPLDTFGRNVYLDTLDSVYGPGWRRENGFLTHHGSGVFCYGFYAHGERPSGSGRLYRATIIGPGVTPDVSWVGAPLGLYDAARDLALHQVQRDVFRDDRLCKPV